jgi:hypothetical protein
VIANDVELATTQERIRYFQNLLAQFRVSTRPEEFQAMASGYRLEIERMQKEVLEYRHFLTARGLKRTVRRSAPMARRWRNFLE